jgi:mitochondrial fission protein ELM1
MNRSLETPFIAVLIKQKCHAFFNKQKKAEQNRSCLVGWYQWEGGGFMARV